MSYNQTPAEKYEEQIRDLVSRLADTEAAIQSLLEGQVDATVDPDTAVPRLLHAAQQRLWRSEQRFRHIQDKIASGILVMNDECVVTHANSAACRLMGMSLGGIEGRTCAELTAGFIREDGAPLPLGECPMEVVMRSGEPARGAVLGVIDAQGSLSRWLLVNAEPLLDEQSGAIKEIVVTLVDITGRRQAEQALQREAKERAVLAEIGRIIGSSLEIEDVYERFAAKVQKLIPFDRISVGLVNHDTQMITAAHTSGVQVPGWSVGDSVPIAQGSARLVVPTGRPTLFEMTEGDVSNPNSPVTLAYKLGLRSELIVPLKYDDRVIAVMVIRSVRPNAYTQHDLALAEQVGAQIAGAIANSQLYAGIKQAEAEAQRERGRLQALLDTSPVGIFVVDAKQRVLLTNREVNRLLKVNVDSDVFIDDLRSRVVIRQSDGTLCPPELYPVHRALHYGERVWAQEARFELDDGRIVPVLMNAMPVYSHDDDITGAIVVVQDITALEDVQQFRSEFLSIVSHELKTPLTSIKGSASTGLSSRRPMSPADVRELFDIIDQEADRLRDLVDNLLDMTRIEAGVLSITTSVDDLRSVLTEARDIFIRSGMSNEVHIAIDDEAPPVKLDRRRVVQVLLNLLTNASKFSPSEAPIFMEAQRDADSVTVRVRDQGCGINPKNLPKLFKKFSRLRNQSAKAVSGTGLGLMICKGIVEAHRGQIWAESEGEGLGATFAFTIPADPEASEAPEPAVQHGQVRRDSTAESAPYHRVLVVDDEHQILRYLQRSLDEAGYESITTGDPSRVLDTLERDNPEVVLLDLQLPGVSGFEVFRRIRQVSQVPVMFLTASGQDEDMVRAMSMGADDYITKPFSPPDLIARIDTVLKRHQARAAEHTRSKTKDEAERPPVPQSSTPIGDRPGGERPPFTLGDLTIAFDECRVTVGGVQVELTDREYRLLCELADNCGRVLCIEDISSRVLHDYGPASASIVRGLVSGLRQKLGDDPRNSRYICTRKRKGYWMPSPGAPV